MADSLWTISFGKHKGCDVEDVPSKYLQWLVLQPWFCNDYPKELNAVQEELTFRDKFNKHIEED